MAYENPNRVTLTFDVVDFGGGADVPIYLPTWKKGCKIWDVGVVDCSEIMNGGTLMPSLRVGNSGSDIAYVKDFSLAALAVQASKSLRQTILNLGLNPADYFVKEGIVPRNGVVILTCKAATGSGLTGMAKPFIVIDYPW